MPQPQRQIGPMPCTLLRVIGEFRGIMGNFGTLTGPAIAVAKRSLRTQLLRRNVSLSRNPAITRTMRLISHCEIDTVVDVGANIGQFASSLRAVGYRGRIVSFEPLADAYLELRHAAERDGEWYTANVALGDNNGTATINRSANSYSSSILEMTRAHSDAAPDSAYIDAKRIEIITLSDAVQNYHIEPRRSLLKVDTQGYEYPVLHGSEAVAREFAMMKLELSLVELYRGQMLYQEMLEYMEKLGFELCGIEEGFVDRQSGRMLQFDGTFVRKGLTLQR